MRYLILCLLLIIFFSCKPNLESNIEEQLTTKVAVLRLNYKNFQVKRFSHGENITEKYDTLLFQGGVGESEGVDFKNYHIRGSSFLCFKRDADVIVRFKFLAENLFSKKKFVYYLYNNLGAIKDVSRLKYLKEEIFLNDWADKMCYLTQRGRGKIIHFTITNDTLKVLSDRKDERTLFFEKDTFVQKYDYSKIEVLSYFEDIDSLNKGFDFDLINITPVKQSDTILFRKWAAPKNEIYLKNRTYKIKGDDCVYYYKTGDTIFSKYKILIQNLKTQKRLSFITYVNQGSVVGYRPEELDAYVTVGRKNNSTGYLDSRFGRKLDPFYLYFKIEKDSLVINKLFSDQYYRNERMTYNLDTLMTVEENELVKIEELWNKHRYNRNKVYLNEYNDKHNLKPQTYINVTPKYKHIPYKSKDTIVKEPLVFNLTFEDYGQCDYHQSFVIFDQIDLSKDVFYNITFKEEFSETIKIKFDQIIIGASHNIFTLKKDGTKIILETQMNNEDDTELLLKINFVFEKNKGKYKLTEMYQIRNDLKHSTEIQLVGGFYVAEF